MLGCDERVRWALDALNRILFKRLSDLLLAQGDTSESRTLLVLDEARELGRLDGLSALLTRGRSRGATVCLGFQDIEGLRKVYGDQVANELVGQCANKALLRIESPETARWASNVLGEYEQFINLVSHTTSRQGPSRTVNEQIMKRDTALPSEFMNLPPSTRANGVSGYYLSPFIGAWRARIPGEFFDRALRERSSSLADFVPRPIHHEYLPPWTEEDYRRLGLELPAGESRSTNDRPPEPRPSPPRIVGRNRHRRNP